MQLADLVTLVRSGDHAAMLELFDRYADMVRRNSSRFGRHVTFDIEDARQTAFISLLTAATEAESSDKDFTAVLHHRILTDLADEAARQRFQVSVTPAVFRLVFETARELDFDFAAAREHLATSKRVARDTFDSVWFWAFGWSGYLSTEDHFTEPADDTAGSDFNAVEDRDAVESLLSKLTDTEREVMERLYGLGDHEPQVSEVVGTVLGMNAASIRRIHSRVTAKLVIHSDLPAHYVVPQKTTRERLRSTKPRTAKKSTSTSFPVTVTRIKEIA